MDAYAHCAELVRERDLDRYLCDLFAPADRRPHLFALHAFDIEAARIRSTVSDPTLGQIRLQWWRDALATDPGGHPVASAFHATVHELRLPLSTVDSYLAARVFDLYDDPMPDMNTLEGYAGETSSALMQMAALMLDAGLAPLAAEASGHAGVAMTVTDIMRRLARAPALAQSFLPADLVHKHQVNRGALVRGETPPGLVPALADLRRVARHHLDRAERAAALLPASLRAAYLPLALVEPRLNRLERHAAKPLSDAGDVGALSRQWRIWRAARRRQA
ncbi:MAG: phytoene/squalene synthase family protein [Alphaproteobacteria bacterium]